MLFILPLLTGCVAVAGCSADAPSKHARETSSTASRSKLDPSLSMMLQQPGSAAQAIDVLIRTRDEIDAAQRAALESQGASVGSVIGDVVTAKVPVSALPGIAGLDFVVRIEPSRAQRLR